MLAGVLAAECHLAQDKVLLQPIPDQRPACAKIFVCC
jgi:hypothetical protein